MYVNAKKMAFLGLLLSFAVILVILSGIIEFNTLFLLIAASFSIGIAIRESGIRLGFGFYIASVLLSLILAPNKIYCLTYSAFGLYLVITEFAWEFIAKAKRIKKRSVILWIIKYATFNLMFIAMLMFVPKLIYPGKIDGKILAMILIGGQVLLFIFDYAYRYFQSEMWGKIRRRFSL